MRREAGELNLATGEILVSASAGTGKTFALSTRIVERVAAGELDLDRLLVMTFTEKAAQEMKKRIHDFFEKRLERLRDKTDSDALRERARLEAQLPLLPRTRISTIHAFCLSVIRDFSYELTDADGKPELDPASRVLDEAESKLLWEEVYEEVLHEAFVRYPDGIALPYPEDKEEREEAEAFYRLVDLYGGGGTAPRLKELLYSSYQDLRSWPNPRNQVEAALREGELQATDFAESALSDRLLLLICERLHQGQSVVRRLLSVLDTREQEGKPLFVKDKKKDADKKADYRAELMGLLRLMEAAESIPDNKPQNAEERRQAWNHLAGLAARVPTSRTPSPRLKSFSDEDYEAVKDFAEAYRGPVSRLLVQFVPGNQVGKTLADDFPEGENSLLLAGDCETMEKAYAAEWPALKMYLRLLLEIDRLYRMKKRQLGGLDFSDFEHDALTLLKKPPVEEYYRGLLQEVYVDEYQDTSLIQEEILRSLPVDTRFRVGDVKQSIYRFRHARPELFVQLDQRLGTSEEGSLFTLGTNYRSAAHILAGVNQLFGLLLSREYTGSYNYNSNHKLEPNTAADTKIEEQEDACMELCFLPYADWGETPRDMLKDVPLPRARALRPKTEDLLQLYMIHRLIEYMRTHRKPGKKAENGQTADARDREYSWRDVAILARDNRACESLAECFRSFGIPVSSKSSRPWYENREVLYTVSFLRLLDNAAQDIPLLSVLASPFYPRVFTEAELAQIRISDRGREQGASRFFHEAYRWFIGAEQEQLTREQQRIQSDLRKFEDWLTRFRLLATGLPLTELLDRAWLESDFTGALAVLPEPEGRLRDLESLRDFIASYERGGQRSLQDFLRYYDSFLENPPRLLENVAQDEGVQIMTYHASKGLDFDIVCLYSLDSQLISRQESSSLFLDEDWGMCASWELKEERCLSPQARLLRGLGRRRAAEEAVRLFYVALTRPKTKLFYFAAGEEKMPTLGTSIDFVCAQTERSDLLWWQRYKTLLDLLLLALIKTEGDGLPAAFPVTDAEGLFYPAQRWSDPGAEDRPAWRIEQLSPLELLDEGSKAAYLDYAARLEEQQSQQKSTPADASAPCYPMLGPVCRNLKQELLRWEEQRLLKKEEESFERRAYYTNGQELPPVGQAPEPRPRPTKVTVSELKREAQAEEEVGETPCRPIDMTLPEPGDLLSEWTEDKTEKKPETKEARALTKLRGAALGTLLHKVFRFLDISRLSALTPLEQEAELREEWKRMLDYRLLSERELLSLEPFLPAYLRFLASPLCARINVVLREGGKIFRETPFTLARGESEGSGLVQGMADLWFIEDGGVVLVDYKSDFISGSEEEVLAELRQRYEIQLQWYARALSQATDLPVKESLIWMIRTGRVYAF